MNINISHKNLLKGLTSNFTKISILLVFILLFSFCSTFNGTIGSIPPVKWVTAGTFTTDGNRNTSSVNENSIAAIQATVVIISNLSAVSQKLIFVVDDGDLSYFNSLKFSLSSDIGSFVPITAESSIVFNSDTKVKTIYFLPVNNDVAEIDNPTYNIKVKFEGQEAKSLGSLTVKNEDTSGIMLTDVTCTGERPEKVEAGNSRTCTFNVSLRSEPTNDVTVSFTTNPADTRVTIPNATFTPTNPADPTNNWNNPRLVTLTITDDNIAQDASVMIEIMATATDYTDTPAMFSFTLTSEEMLKIMLTTTNCVGTL